MKKCLFSQQHTGLLAPHTLCSKQTHLHGLLISTRCECKQRPHARPSTLFHAARRRKGQVDFSLPSLCRTLFHSFDSRMTDKFSDQQASRSVLSDRKAHSLFLGYQQQRCMISKNKCAIIWIASLRLNNLELNGIFQLKCSSNRKSTVLQSLPSQLEIETNKIIRS